MKSLILGFLLALVSTPALAENNKPSNFAYQSEIQTGKQSLQSVEIPFEIYQKLEQSDHKDLRVFDTNGQEVPSMVAFPNDSVDSQTLIEPINFFIKPELEKSVFNPTTRETRALQSTFFIDNRQGKYPITQFELDWDNSQQSTTLSVQIKASADMSNWTTIETSDFIYDLHHLGENLQNKMISLQQASNSHYFALQFTASENGLAPKVTSIKAHYQKNQPQKAVAYQQSIKNPAFRSKNNSLLFHIPKSLKIKSLSITAPKATGLYKGNLYSADLVKTDDARSKREELKQKFKDKIKGKTEQNTEPFNWQYRDTFFQYQLTTDMGKLSSDAIEINHNNQYRHWKTHFNQPKTLRENNLPTLSYTWQPATLTFLAQGTEPFSLYFGSEEYLSSRPSLSGLTGLSTPESVELNDMVSFKTPENKTEIQIESEQQDYQWLLWTILIVGLLLMGFIAYRVVGSLKE